MSKIHYTKTTERVYWPIPVACGLRLLPPRTSSNIEEVTCERCQRSHAKMLRLEREAQLVATYRYEVLAAMKDMRDRNWKDFKVVWWDGWDILMDHLSKDYKVYVPEDDVRIVMRALVREGLIEVQGLVDEGTNLIHGTGYFYKKQDT